MTENKRTVASYMDGFNKSDHEQILACLTDDVEWDIAGAFHIIGKGAFDSEIENEAFIGPPIVTTKRMTEENDVVIVEGFIKCERTAGGFLNLVFCDVFEMRDYKIRRLISYLVEIK